MPQDVSYKRWVELGRPGLSYDDWRWWQTGDTSDRKSEGDTHSPEWMRAHGNDPNATVSGGSSAPMTFEQRMAAGEFAGREGEATALEVKRRRGLIASNANGSGGANGGFDELPPDLADIALRNATTGRLRRARQGSTRNSLLGGFAPLELGGGL